MLLEWVDEDTKCQQNYVYHSSYVTDEGHQVVCCPFMVGLQVGGCELANHTDGTDIGRPMGVSRHRILVVLVNVEESAVPGGDQIIEGPKGVKSLVGVALEHIVLVVHPGWVKHLVTQELVVPEDGSLASLFYKVDALKVPL